MTPHPQAGFVKEYRLSDTGWQFSESGYRRVEDFVAAWRTELGNIPEPDASKSYEGIIHSQGAYIRELSTRSAVSNG